MIKINKQELRLLAEMYNSDGKKAMYAFLQAEYEIKNPTCTFKRMKQHTELGYNPETDRFLFDNKSCASEDKVFMTIDELCAPSKNKQNTPFEKRTDNSEEMENLIHELIGERLLELSRYISINSISKTLIIDKTSLIRDGYQVTMH
ncbi:MAG: hypothetical protein J6K43_04480 [Lachnospiraceae bacterium]|nr:hypothetical protein [Lachnospiraceae bacterium]